MGRATAVAVLTSSPFLCPDHKHAMLPTGTRLATVPRRAGEDGSAQGLRLWTPGAREAGPSAMRPHRKAKLPAGEGRWHPQAHARTSDLQRAPPLWQGLLEAASKGGTDPKPAALSFLGPPPRAFHPSGLTEKEVESRRHSRVQKIICEPVHFFWIATSGLL